MSRLGGRGQAGGARARPEDLTRVRERTRDGLCVLGLRFSDDKLSPSERFATLRRALGGAFEGIEIDSSPGNPYGIPARAHSVLAIDFVDEPGHPTRAALDPGTHLPARAAPHLTQRTGPPSFRGAGPSPFLDAPCQPCCTVSGIASREALVCS